MKIPILNGIYTDSGPDMRVSYPVNMVPVVQDSGASPGYLRPAHGIVSWTTGPGVDRGGINWNGTCYRVMGTKLVSVSSVGVVTTLGDVGGSGQATFDYSFDRLAIVSSGALYYWDGASLTQVTDVDLGTVIDAIWIDGYFMTTDGENLIVTELADPTQVSPSKYGSSEIDPDEVKGLLKVRNEAYALNRYTIEVMTNIGGNFFPYERIEGAQIQKGVIGTHCACTFGDAIAFVGSGHNERAAIYLGSNSQALKISTQEIDRLIGEYAEADLATSVLEQRVDGGHNHLIFHLPDRAIVYDAIASQLLGEPVWFTLTSGIAGFSEYRAKNMVWCYDKWIVGDPTTTALGYLSDTVSTHFGANTRWEFGTKILYNEGRGAILHSLELIALTGRVALGIDPQIMTSYSLDGETWSQGKWIKCGKIGDRSKRLVWLQQGALRNYRMQRFSGDSQSHLSFMRLDATIEPLEY